MSRRSSGRSRAAPRAAAPAATAAGGAGRGALRVSASASAICRAPRRETSCSRVHHSAISARGQAELRAQQQQVIGGAEARVLQRSAARAGRAGARAAAAAQTSRAAEREAPRNRRCASAPRAPPDRRHRRIVASSCQRSGGVRLDDAARSGPYKRSANRKVGVTGLSATHARIGIREPLHQQLLDQAARMAR